MKEFIIETHEEVRYKRLKKAFIFIIKFVFVIVNKIVLRNNSEKPQIAP